MSTLKATIIVPTSIDRGPLLGHSVGSVLTQTVRELEVFIIGDGAHEVTREAARALEKQDARVRFFDHPKGPRRGEIYRHQALQEARGEIVCYLCDRDLYLSDHVEEMSRLLQQADFAHTLIFNIEIGGEWGMPKAFDLADPVDRRRLSHTRDGVPLSFGGHTLAMYRQLPQGWDSTPLGFSTDVFMAQKFLRHPTCRLASGLRPTVLSFRRGVHPGWSTAQRLAEVAPWSVRLREPAEVDRVRARAIGLIHHHRVAQARILARLVVVGGEPLSLRTFLLPWKWLRQTVYVFLVARADRAWARWVRNTWRRLTGRPPV